MSKVSTKLRSWRIYVLLGILAFVALIGVGIILSETSTCSFLRGTCGYDPRTQQPSSMFIAQPPEQFVVQYIQDEIKQYGTYPITATSTVSSVVATWVHAHGFNTDWLVQADVIVLVQYNTEAERHFDFELMGQTARTLLGIENTTMFVGFGPLRECDIGPTGIRHGR